MRVFGISDLHLSLGGSDKPMDRYGSMWVRHWEKIEARWRERVRPDDVVLVAGDHSWGLKMPQVLPDLEFIARLPGTKVMGKGNHDMWWHGNGKLQKLGLPDVFWVQASTFSRGGLHVAGSRGWSLPGTEFCQTEEDQAVFARELERMKRALEMLPTDGWRMAMTHYPPLLSDLRDTPMSRLFQDFNIRQVVYGHLHVGHLARAFQGTHAGVEYRMVSCDVNGFEPVEMVEV
ncbi:MAG TPA: metallophosphoesterase [Candidatus Xenobia bacterium]